MTTSGDADEGRPERSDHLDRRQIVEAGYRGDTATALAGLSSEDPSLRRYALGALDRLGVLTEDQLTAALGDPDHRVRHRATELAARYPTVHLAVALDDDHPSVIETAAWACGEHSTVPDPILDRLIALTSHDDALVRESAVAALGAIGDERGRPAILAALNDRASVRRRAVLALAPFDGPDIDAALERALTDRDWQVRQGAEDIKF
ncbi:MAG: hypothetical protein CSA55_04025 [Ilumatobacter coccineus]|uniref:HEAT repeat domain-containing protein n=1 Tax=Ilumatobacter coccineus TaxID=467094 RepID=A0A2G6K9R2_9ACTN|nr:MAG: hypothetical protein CSA55_04025 [Ilumatobacter coccineus]